MIGQKFNRLTVVCRADNYITPSGAKERRWLCECDCGNTTVVTTAHLKSGHTKSCGCFAMEMRIQNGLREKHGLTRTRIHGIWTQMKTRCYNPNDEHFPNYGGRGITVCAEWLNDVKAFHEWAMANGYADYLTIDRIDTNGNYCPENCRWASKKEQTRNRRNTRFLTFNDETKTLKEWSEITGIKYQTLFCRYKAGKSPEEILRR